MKNTVVYIYLCVYVAFSVFISVNSGTSSKTKARREPISTETYITQFGYPVEVHFAITQDGYNLTLHRIPYGKSQPAANFNRKPVLLQHGLLRSSIVWVFMEHSLAYLLADAGFDVWMGNARGNLYSRRHIELDPDNNRAQFWDFSWHEIGYHDLPASIDYILRVNGNRQLFYIGHSMGTTAFFVMASTKSAYTRNYVQAAVALAPVLSFSNVRSGLAHVGLKLASGLYRLGIVHELMRYSYFTYMMNRDVCSKKKLQFICKKFLFAIFGKNEKALDPELLPNIIESASGGTSLKLMVHYKQINKKGSPFKQFDYGKKGNMDKYYTNDPPIYDLRSVKLPIYMYYGENDLLVSPQDAKDSANALSSSEVSLKKVPDENFSHGDFLWAKDIKAVLNDDVVNTLCKLTPCL